MFLDAHLHLRDPRLHPHREAFLQTMVDTGITTCIDCASDPLQWHLPPPTHPHLKIITAYGIHPWSTPNATRENLSTLEQHLQTSPSALIGEIGYDGLHAQTEIERQQQDDFFIAQLQLASTYQRPIILHGTRAWQKLFDQLLPRCSSLPSLLLHGVNFAPEMLNHPLFRAHHNIWFSLGSALSNPNFKQLHRLLPQLPLQRILIESDAPDGCPKNGKTFHNINHPENFKQTLHALTHHLQLPYDTLLPQLHQNAQTFLSTLP